MFKVTIETELKSCTVAWKGVETAPEGREQLEWQRSILDLLTLNALDGAGFSKLEENDLIQQTWMVLMDDDPQPENEFGEFGGTLPEIVKARLSVKDAASESRRKQAEKYKVALLVLLAELRLMIIPVTGPTMTVTSKGLDFDGEELIKWLTEVSSLCRRARVALNEGKPPFYPLDLPIVTVEGK